MSVCYWHDGYADFKHYCDEKEEKQCMGVRFSYVKYDSEAAAKQEKFKKMFEELEDFATAALAPGRPSSLVMTKLEEAYMWVGKSIRDEQIARGGDSAHIAERTNE